MVNNLPALPENIPVEYNGKTWPVALSNLLMQSLASVDNGKMLEFLEKQATPYVSFIFKANIDKNLLCVPDVLTI